MGVYRRRRSCALWGLHLGRWRCWRSCWGLAWMLLALTSPMALTTTTRRPSTTSALPCTTLRSSAPSCSIPRSLVSLPFIIIFFLLLFCYKYNTPLPPTHIISFVPQDQTSALWFFCLWYWLIDLCVTFSCRLWFFKRNTTYLLLIWVLNLLINLLPAWIMYRFILCTIEYHLLCCHLNPLVECGKPTSKLYQINKWGWS